MRTLAADGLDLLAEDSRTAIAWHGRIARDRQRARDVQSDDLGRATELLVARSVAAGAEAVALTGSTARGRRTAASDLDLHVVGPRPSLDGLRIDVDVYATTAEVLLARLRAGDDYAQWTLRFGCILYDTGVLRAAAVELAMSATWPSPERKLDQVHRMLRVARSVLASGDREAATEQVRSVLTGLARWRLLAVGAFPMSRAELPGQLRDHDEDQLAAALDCCIHSEPTLRQLQVFVELADAMTAVAGRAAAR